jgi:replicative DNA helicase
MAIEKGRLTDEAMTFVREVAEHFRNLPLYFYDQSTSTDQLKSVLAQHKNDHGLDVCVVDYIALMTDTAKSPYEKLTMIADKLRNQAKDFDIPLIVASQLNRASLNGKPTLSALKESGQVENNAGGVIFPYREAMESGEQLEDPTKEPATIIIAKNRHGPNHVEFPCYFLPQKMQWKAKEYEVIDPMNAMQEKRSIG